MDLIRLVEEYEAIQARAAPFVAKRSEGTATPEELAELERNSRRTLALLKLICDALRDDSAETLAKIILERGLETLRNNNGRLWNGKQPAEPLHTLLMALTLAMWLSENDQRLIKKIEASLLHMQEFYVSPVAKTIASVVDRYLESRRRGCQQP